MGSQTKSVVYRHHCHRTSSVQQLSWEAQWGPLHQQPEHELPHLLHYLAALQLQQDLLHYLDALGPAAGQHSAWQQHPEAPAQLLLPMDEQLFCPPP